MCVGVAHICKTANFTDDFGKNCRLFSGALARIHDGRAEGHWPKRRCASISLGCCVKVLQRRAR